MTNPVNFYKEQLENLSEKRKSITKKLSILQLFRLVVFFVTALVVYLTINLQIIPVFFGVFGFFSFTYLVLSFLKTKKHLANIDARIAINETEIEVLQGNFRQLPTGSMFANPMHYFSHDIDLFGKGSFFQYLNRTITFDGKVVLANILTSNGTSNVSDKQKAVQELSEKVHWREDFSSLKKEVSAEEEATKKVAWMGDYTAKLGTFWGMFSRLFSLASLTLIGLMIFGILPFSILLYWYITGLIIAFSQLKKTQALYTQASHTKAFFSQYYPLLALIEKEKFTATILKEKQQKILTGNIPASKIFKTFSKILDAFDQRNNLVMLLVGNSLFLWDIMQAAKTEKWINTHKKTVVQWFEAVRFFDAQNSLANFTFNHPEYVFPSLKKQEKNQIVNAHQLGHPLLATEKRVNNDFLIDQQQFFIITGANMAGKSTFLRTLSLSMVMANCGLPVCAKSYQYTPIKLITSMRTSDSLSEDESYFYAELKRLKFIVDKIKNDQYFIILDEILKGTNSKDKATGSKQFVEKLTNSKSTGIIATHDVSLCDLSEEFTTIDTFYFDAEITNDELSFDYKIKKGVCKNMNASFLLKKMEIV